MVTFLLQNFYGLPLNLFQLLNKGHEYITASIHEYIGLNFYAYSVPKFLLQGLKSKK